jgi:hypothetical protein
MFHALKHTRSHTFHALKHIRSHTCSTHQARYIRPAFVFLWQRTACCKVPNISEEGTASIFRAERYKCWNSDKQNMNLGPRVLVKGQWSLYEPPCLKWKNHYALPSHCICVLHRIPGSDDNVGLLPPPPPISLHLIFISYCRGSKPAGHGRPRGRKNSHNVAVSLFYTNFWAKAVPWLRRSVAGISPRSSGSIPGQSMWDLWLTKLHCDRFFSQFFSFPLSVSFHQCSILFHPSPTFSV